MGALATESRKMQLEGCWCSAPPLEGARCTQQNRNQGGKTREGKADPVTKGRQTERLGGKDRQMDTHREKHGERNSQEGGGRPTEVRVGREEPRRAVNGVGPGRSGYSEPAAGPNRRPQLLFAEGFDGNWTNGA